MLRLVDEELRGRLPREGSRQGETVLVPYDRRVARFGLGMAVHETEESHPEPGSEIVGPLGRNLAVRGHDQAVVAGSAGRRLEILADLPGNGVEVPGVILGRVDVAVLALFVDVPRRHVRIEMALAAGVRLPGHLDREPV